jgi:hypothetical protein
MAVSRFFVAALAETWMAYLVAAAEILPKAERLPRRRYVMAGQCH